MQYRILIVDDSDFSRSTIANMLTDEKYNVIGEAASAKEAINILRDRKAHLVIIDIVMPEVSGIELAEYITENFQNTSIIMISSLAQESIVIDSISSGASDFLQKPFSKEDLVTSIDKILADIQEE
ncbi:MAG: response regulator [Bdellovibrionota bacterium]|nr:response regulator [Bdellovibrionota bacterium]